MNVKIGTEAEQFQEKKYINGVFFAVYLPVKMVRLSSTVELK
jgi:hypothetical protein